MTEPLPTAEIAIDVVIRHLGWRPTMARRFTSGLAFFVFDVSDENKNVVVRLGRPLQAPTLRAGVTLAEQLRPLGVPLPLTIASGVEQGFPFVVQSRLPGTDLGNVMNTLDRASLDRIARGVADAQLATARLGPARRFGHATSAESAPHECWTDVVAAHIARSEHRILANGLFAPDVIAQTRSLFARHAEALAAIPATPFLHDTTTKNVIIAPSGALSGIVDVDDLCFGDSRYTAALTYVAMLVHGGPLDYVATWLAHTGQPRDALFRLYITVFLLDFMSEHGTSFNGNEGASQPEGRAHLLRLFHQSLA